MFKSYSYLDQIKHGLLANSHDSITRHDLQKHVNLHMFLYIHVTGKMKHTFSVKI